jgi:hypothetical protein
MIGNVPDALDACPRLQYTRVRAVIMEHLAMAAIIEIWRQRVKEI